MGPTRSPVAPLTPREAAAALADHHRLSLPGCHALRGALARPTGDPGWHERVGAHLRELRGAFGEHVTVTEGPTGLYAQLVDSAPRLARGVHMLVDEHAAVAAGLSVLQQRIDDATPAVDELRLWAVQLLRQLSRHRQRGADLLYQAYVTDIGGET